MQAHISIPGRLKSHRLHSVAVHPARLVPLQAQNLAELAIDAREKADKAHQKVAESERDVEAAKVVREKLEADIEQLRHVSADPSAEKDQAFRADQTVDLGTSEQGTPTAEQSLDAELKSKLQQLDGVKKTIDETDSKLQFLEICYMRACTTAEM